MNKHVVLQVIFSHEKDSELNFHAGSLLGPLGNAERRTGQKKTLGCDTKAQIMPWNNNTPRNILQEYPRGSCRFIPNWRMEFSSLDSPTLCGNT